MMFNQLGAKLFNEAKERKYYNGDCDFHMDCINGENVGGTGSCKDCIHNFEEEKEGRGNVVSLTQKQKVK